MKKNKSIPLGLKILLFISCTSIALTPINENIRYAKYFLIVPAFIFFIFDYSRLSDSSRKSELNKFLSTYLILYSSMILFSFIVITVRNDYYTRFFAEAFFILSPAILVYLYFRLGYLIEIEMILKLYFFAYSINYLIDYNSAIIDLIIHPSYIIPAFLTSKLETESTLSYLFGMFTIYFIYRKNKLYTMLAVLFAIISFKRIAIFALFVCLLIDFIFMNRERIKNGLKYLKNLGILANIVFIFLVYMFARGSFDQTISNWTGLSANSFTKGRKFVYESVLINLKPDVLTGTGLAKTSDFLENFNANIILLHCDILKIFLEFGIIAFILWLVVQFNLNSKSKEMLILFIFINIIFLTDNSFIYFNVSFVFYLMQSANIMYNNKIIVT